jgi:hypothetical protein
LAVGVVFVEVAEAVEAEVEEEEVEEEEVVEDFKLLKALLKV